MEDEKFWHETDKPATYADWSFFLLLVAMAIIFLIGAITFLRIDAAPVVTLFSISEIVMLCGSACMWTISKLTE